MGSSHSDRFDDAQAESRDHSHSDNSSKSFEYESESGDSSSEAHESERDSWREPDVDKIGKIGKMNELVQDVYKEGLALVTKGVARDKPEYRKLDVDTLQKLQACRKYLDVRDEHWGDALIAYGLLRVPPLLVTLAWLDLCSSAEYLLDWHKAFDRKLIDEDAKFETHTAWDWAVLNNSVCMKRLLRQDLDLPSER